MKRLVAVLSLVFCLALPATALAYNPLDAACQGAGKVSSACSTTGQDPISGKNGVLKKATLIIASIAGIAAVIIVLIGGFQYITSAGDPQKAASARSMILGAVVGLVIIAAAEGILTFVLSKL